MVSLTPTKQELTLASQIFERCTLESVCLVNCSTESAPYGQSLIQPYMMAIDEAETKHAEVRDENIVAVVDFIVTSDDSTDSKTMVFKLSCRYSLVYKLEQGFVPTQEQIDAFSKGNPIYNCWPYFRELVQNLAFRMGHFPPPLPLLRVKAKKDTPPPTEGKRE